MYNLGSLAAPRAGIIASSPDRQIYPNEQDESDTIQLYAMLRDRSTRAQVALNDGFILAAPFIHLAKNIASWTACRAVEGECVEARY